MFTCSSTLALLLSLPANMVRQIMKSFAIIGNACRPCVVSGFFRTLWNGWPTSARMRTMSGAQRTQECVLGCKGAEDRIEHYLVCSKAWSVLQQRPPYGLGLNLSRRTLEAMLLTDAGLADEERMAIAIGCYAVSRTVQCLRHRQASLRAAPIMRLYISDGLRGSKARVRILNRWAQQTS